ncbi:hypothetical protein SAMN05518800_6892 [Variovorax sp. YR752]|uniref:hypothetical protein n=1 Tax=Variovorax sp. YR752 TaxID=1884383 RepID=UPI000BC454E4|nr:hypothetical protein [Variovorax sp. YR752]SOE06256.1 hypothetical protein SAMN05518800_6892 [Variovorax sp. YR752]
MADPDIEVLAAAADFDPALRAKATVLGTLARKRIGARSARREDLFAAIAQGHPFVGNDIEVPVARAGELGLQTALLRAFAGTFKQGESARAQVGPRHARRRLAISELLRRWQSSRHIVSITDLHVRGTRLERLIDTDRLSAFNLLPLGSETMRRQEMMTLVISSRGNVTDSHSDDPDGSNHCFVGKKLWFAWETFEGQRAGLQDCSRDVIDKSAHFDLDTFSSLKSARWWTVGPGETLFLPGRLSHRVVTLEPYIGIGSFYCTPASCLENLSRWYKHGALWSLDDPDGDNDGLVDEIATMMTRKLRRLAHQAARGQQRWGMDFIELASVHWRRRWTEAQRRKLMTNPQFARLVHALDHLAKSGPVSISRPARS